MFRWKTVLVFVLAMGIAFAAAAYRFSDSSHAIGMLSVKGGKARHPFMVKSGHDIYTLIMTGIVLPPYRGDVRIALEGSPVMNYTIYNTDPVVNLGFHRRPNLDGITLRGVESGDRLALWVVMQPKLTTDVEGEGADISCCVAGPALLNQSDEAGQHGQQPLVLSFYSAETNQQLLKVPVVFTDLQQGGGHGS